MSHFEQTKCVVLSITLGNGEVVSAEHELNYYDAEHLDVPEFSYDAEDYQGALLTENESDLLSEMISEYLDPKFRHGLSAVVDGEIIHLRVANGMLVEDN